MNHAKRGQPASPPFALLFSAENQEIVPLDLRSIRSAVRYARSVGVLLFWLPLDPETNAKLSRGLDNGEGEIDVKIF